MPLPMKAMLMRSFAPKTRPVAGCAADGDAFAFTPESGVAVAAAMPASRARNWRRVAWSLLSLHSRYPFAIESRII